MCEQYRTSYIILPSQTPQKCCTLNACRWYAAAQYKTETEK